MKSLLLTLIMLVISSTALASEKDGKWVGVAPGAGTMTFEFRFDGKKLYGTTQGIGDSKIDIKKGKIKKKKISFEVPVTMGGSKLSVAFKGEIISDDEIELSFKTRSRGSRGVGFDGFNDGFSGGTGGSSGGAAGFSVGFGGGGGFGGVKGESAKFKIKRMNDKPIEK